MKFTKGKDAKERGSKGGKNTYKRYGKRYMSLLAKKRWAGDKSPIAQMRAVS